MQEIKFRAWYQWEKRMLEWDELKEDMDEFLCILEDKVSDVSPAMQYTGLKDKNGVEIYEGDVVQHDDESPYCKIDFEDGCFVLKELTQSGNEWFLYTEAELVEVIGNIYENPELLSEVTE